MARWLVTMEFAEKVVKHFNTTPDATVRSTAEACRTSKSTVHRILTKVLPNETSRAKLDKNKKEAPYRGIEAIRRKYRGE